MHLRWDQEVVRGVRQGDDEEFRDFAEATYTVSDVLAWNLVSKQDDAKNEL